jgi:hypothetical protein
MTATKRRLSRISSLCFRARNEEGSCWEMDGKELCASECEMKTFLSDGEQRFTVRTMSHQNGILAKHSCQVHYRYGIAGGWDYIYVFGRNSNHASKLYIFTAQILEHQIYVVTVKSTKCP